MLPVIPRGIITRLSSKQKPSLTDLIPFEVLKLLRKLFFEAVGMDILIADFEGRWLFDTDMQDSICWNLYSDDKKIRTKCLKHFIEAATQSRKLNEPYISQCHAGFKGVSKPIFLRNMDIAILHCGPMRDNHLGPQQTMPRAHESGIEIKKYLQLISTVPVFEANKVKVITESLNYIGLLISSLAQQTLEKEENALRLSYAYEELRKIEGALRESEMKYKDLTENSLTGIFIIQDDVFKFVNSRFKSMLGYSWEELQNIQPIDMVDSDSRSIVLKITNPGGRKADISSEHEVVILKKNGERIWCEFRTTYINYRGKAATMGNIIDITERKRTEEALKKSQADYLTLINHLPMGVTLINENHEIIMTNEAQGKFFGKDPAYFIGKRCYHAFEGKEKPDFDCPGIVALRTSAMAEKEMEIMLNGEIKSLRVQAYPVLDEGGKAIGFTELVKDRTQKREAERKIAILQNAIEGAKESIVIVDLTGHVIYTNKATSDIFEYSREEMLGKHVNIYHGSNRGEEIMSFLTQNLAWSGEFSGKNKSGETVPVYLLCSVIRDTEGIPIGFLGIMEDLTEKKKLEGRLKEAESKYLILKKQLEEKAGLDLLIGSDPKIIEIKELVKNIGDTDVTVLLQGETGTGKELVATLIHQESSRRDKPFIRVNCASLSETLLESELFGHEKGAFTGAIRQKKGKFELANKGTIFLDEIGDISPRMQVAILRVIEKGEIQRVGGEETLTLDVRIIAATNKPLEKAMREETFRKDLYYRLNSITITLPPLRERKEDILILIHHFLQKHQGKYKKKIESLPSEVLESLIDYPWPGNIRELENTIERIVLTAKDDKINIDYFHKYILLKKDKEESYVESNIKYLKDLPLKRAVNMFEKKVINAVLVEENHNIYNAIKKLHISRSCLYEKLKNQ